MAAPRTRKAPAVATAKRPRTRKASSPSLLFTLKPPVRKAPAPSRVLLQKRVVRAGVAQGMKLAGVGSDAVIKATGKAWEEWLRLLDSAGAKNLAHKDIALLLARQFRVPDWWSQMVTVGYEQARGLRAVNQRADGYAANTSRTIGTPLGKLYDAWSDPVMRARWLLDAPVEVCRCIDGKSMRMTWTAGGSRVDVGFYSKGERKSMVAVQHVKLGKASDVARQKAFWSEALERLKALLEPSLSR
jgi:hypothetical protein